jgi:excisionase family DNA binding protein
LRPQAEHVEGVLNSTAGLPFCSGFGYAATRTKDSRRRGAATREPFGFRSTVRVTTPTHPAHRVPRALAEQDMQISVSDVQSPLLTIDEVARILRQSRRTVERHVASGEIPSVKLGSTRGSAIRVHERDLVAWIYRD